MFRRGVFKPSPGMLRSSDAEEDEDGGPQGQTENQARDEREEDCEAEIQSPGDIARTEAGQHTGGPSEAGGRVERVAGLAAGVGAAAVRWLARVCSAQLGCLRRQEITGAASLARSRHGRGRAKNVGRARSPSAAKVLAKACPAVLLSAPGLEADPPPAK